MGYEAFMMTAFAVAALAVYTIAATIAARKANR